MQPKSDKIRAIS